MNLKQLKNLDNVSLNMDAEHNGEKVKEIFCTYWEGTRRGLELLQAMVKNPIAKGIIAIVLAVGDGVENRLCGPKPRDTEDGN